MDDSKQTGGFQKRTWKPEDSPEDAGTEGQMPPVQSAAAPDDADELELTGITDETPPPDLLPAQPGRPLDEPPPTDPEMAPDITSMRDLRGPRPAAPPPDESAAPPPDDEESHVEATTLWQPSDEAIPEQHTLLWLVARIPAEKRGVLLSVPPNSVIGRGRDAHVRWDDPRMSRIHARVTFERDPERPEDPQRYYFLWPLAPYNPILLNRQAIRGAVRLAENDEITIGDTTFVVKTLD